MITRHLNNRTNGVEPAAASMWTGECDRACKTIWVTWLGKGLCSDASSRKWKWKQQQQQQQHRQHQQQQQQGHSHLIALMTAMFMLYISFPG